MISSEIAREIVISESLKLANKYCSAEAPKFINGVLADAMKQLQGA
jgi:transcription termination factor NusB